MKSVDRSKLGLQTIPGCCCGCLEGHTKCCRCECTCRRLCVTFTPEDELDSNYQPCEVVSDELAWNASEEAFIGEVAGIDVRYYFEQEGDECYFKLRSAALGFPEGYEAAWGMGSDYGDLDCSNLATEVSVPATPYVDCSAGKLTTSCAVKIVPQNCTGCGCTCECLCISYFHGDCTVGARACWDGYGSWRGTVKCGPYEEIDIVISMGPKGMICDPETDPYCDPDDDRCVLLLSMDSQDHGEGVHAACPDVSSSWTIAGSYGEEDTVITARCARCAEDCKLQPPVGCCVGYTLPDVLYTTLQVRLRVYDLEHWPGGPYLPGDPLPPYPLVEELDCATYVFTSVRDPVFTNQWNGEWLFTPECGCLGDQFIPTSLRVTVQCIPLVNESKLVVHIGGAADECAFHGGNGYAQDTFVFNCEPFLARFVVDYGKDGNIDLFRFPGADRPHSWCCGMNYIASHGTPWSWLYSTRVIFTTTG